MLKEGNIRPVEPAGLGVYDLYNGGRLFLFIVRVIVRVSDRSSPAPVIERVKDNRIKGAFIRALLEAHFKEQSACHFFIL